MESEIVSHSFLNEPIRMQYIRSDRVDIWMNRRERIEEKKK